MSGKVFSIVSYAYCEFVIGEAHFGASSLLSYFH